MDRVTMFYMPSSDPSDENSVDIAPPDKQYSIDGLRPDTEYTVSLISRSRDITSDPVTATFTTGRLVIITALLCFKDECSEIIKSVKLIMVCDYFTAVLCFEICL